MSEGRIAASPPLPGHRLGHQLVRADAGAGKTYSLAVRYLALVAAGAAPEKILAATFTRKAAGEILERILLRLARAALDPASAEGLARDLGSAVEPVRARRFAELLAGLCAGLHRVQVGTLDAFFHRVTTAFRLELGIPTVTTVAAAGDPGLAPLRLAAVERALGELAAEGEDALVELLGRLYRGDAARSVASALDRVVLEVYETFRLAPELSAWRRLEIPHSRLGEEELRAAVERLGDEAAGFDGALLEALSKDHAQARRGDWLGFLVDGPAAKIAEDPQQPSYRRRPLPKSLVRAYAPLVEHARWDLLERLARQTEATHRLVAAFDRHFERLRRARGVVLFSDFSRLLTHHFARLGEEALLGLFYRLDARVEHLLLDEFQDTSREQWLALAWLAEEILAWGDGSRTMFCVGDPKQSIYGWRGGCAELFDLVESRLLGDHRAAFGGGRDDELGGGLEDGPGSGSEGGLEDGSGPGSEGGLEGRPIGAGSVAPATVVSALERSAPLRRLGVSFRSSPVVLAAVDAVFARLAHNRALAEGPPREEAARWVARYQRHEAAVPERPGWVRLITSGEWEGEFPPDAPPGAIDPEGEEADQEEAAEAQRPVGHLAFVADRVAEIAARSQPNSPGGDRGQVPNSEGGDGYLSPISVGVLTLTNRTAAELLALLRERGVEASGEGGGPLIDDPAVTAALSALWLAAHPGDSAAAFHVARSPLGGVLGLDDFRSPEDVSRRVRSELLERGTPSVLAEWARALQPATSRRSGARLAQLVELAETHEREGLGGPFDLVARARAATLEEPSPAPVRVMTVHRAKGLEFDVVVLPELERRLGDLNNPLILLDRPAAIAPIAALFRGTNQTVRSCSEQLTAVHAQEVARRVADDLGVLYVALTRARHELLLVVQPVASSKSGRRTFAELLRHALAEAGRDRWKEGGATLYEDGSRVDLMALRRERTGPITTASTLEDSVEDSVDDEVDDEVDDATKPGAGAEAASEVDSATKPGASADADSEADSEVFDETRASEPKQGRRPRRAPRLLLERPSYPAGPAGASAGVRELLRLEPAGERLRGSLIHAWLREVEWLREGAGLPSDERALDLARRVASGVERSQILAWLRELAQSLEAPEIAEVFVRPAGRKDAYRLWRERPFALARGGRLVRGVIDRALIWGPSEAPAGAELFELKSDRVGTPREEAIAERVERYRHQVLAYREALATMLGLLPTAVRGSLVLLDAGVVVAVE